MISSNDSLDFAAARQAMIDSQLKPQGVADRDVLAAFAAVARERFVPAEVRALAYADRALPLGEGRSMMPPAALGALLDALLPQPGERAFVYAPASGYTAAVLEAMGLTVDSGEAAAGPYDLILIDGAVEAIPDALIAALADGGRLGGAIADLGVTRLVTGRKSGSAFGLRSIGDAAVPRLPGTARPREFTF